jgi:2-haloalkanoic acid dehalogenase type II
VSGGKFRAVVFDLLTGLLDSWTLWDSIAGNVGDGRRWRSAYLKNTYAEGGYRPYETLVREAAVEIGRSPDLGERQAARYDELKPWPEVPEVLGKLQGAFRLGIVTNCSEALGRSAASRTGIAFDTIVTAERAGFYKPRPEAYRLALNELGAAAAECLFVAGSAYDLFGAAAVGMPVFWHDRIGMPTPPDAPPPLARHDSLYPLPAVLFRDNRKMG